MPSSAMREGGQQSNAHLLSRSRLLRKFSARRTAGRVVATLAA
jgi:hypothetical protein